MPSPAFDVHLGNPDPGFKPTSLLQLYNDIDSKLSGTFQNADSYIPYVVSPTTPNVEDNDKIWIRTVGGKPVGQYMVYGGQWRKIYTGNPLEVRLFIGNPATYFNSNGLGLAGGEWDGWHLMNGKDGVPNVSDRFMCIGHLDNSSGQSGYNSTDGWLSTVDGGLANHGGQREVTLGLNQIPRDPKDAVLLDKFTADGNARSNTGPLFGHYSGTHDPDGSEAITVADAGNTDPDVVPTLPPYFVIALVMFVGYA